jgi:hypothetical protein
MNERPKSIFRSMPGFPFYPCKACAAEGAPMTGTACAGDHTARERALAWHPGLMLDQPQAEPS